MSTLATQHPVATFHGIMTNGVFNGQRAQYFRFDSQTPVSRQYHIWMGELPNPPDPVNIGDIRYRLFVSEQSRILTMRIKGMCRTSEGYLLIYSPSVPMVPETNDYVILELDDSKFGNDQAKGKLNEWCEFWKLKN